MKKLLIPFIICLFLSFFGCGNISGTVEENGVPLEGVQIELWNQFKPMNTQTNLDGQFNFTEVAPGGTMVTPVFDDYVFTPRSYLMSITFDLMVDNLNFEAENVCIGQTCFNGDFEINSPDDLADFSGYTIIIGDLIIKGNVNLTDLDGLESLTKIYGNLIIDGTFVAVDKSFIEINNSLVNLDGLSNLTLIRGKLTITNNSKLCESIALAFRDNVLPNITDEITISGNMCP